MRRVVCVGLLLVLGCDSGEPRRYELSGQVTFKGQPVPVGTIVFVPNESMGNRGPGTTAGIADGVYRTAPGQGTIGGPHKVRISGYDGKVKPIPGAPDGQTMPANPPLFQNIELEVDLPRADSTMDFHLPKR
ncbi:MAG: hypothetical protein N2039_01980 [Gemmataceae bacterium]|nr:hypothetical protein [Gemmataceae bacterium]